MATARKIVIDPALRPVYGAEHLTPESAKKTSELLQKNHEQFNIFFNNEGFHNHIAHHLLSVYALGATPSEIQARYNDNTSYQMKLKKFNDSKVQEMLDSPEAFEKHLGVNSHYPDFLEFFTREIEAKGWETVLQEYLWAEDDRAKDMFVRLFAGFLHPLIELGFALEFAQPALIAEALAQTAVHDTWLGKFLLPASHLAHTHGDPSLTLESIRQTILTDKDLVNSAHWTDANKIRDGILVRAPEAMIHAAAQYTVPPSDLEERTAEMMNFSTWFTAAAQREPYEVKFDFFYMHCINCAIFFPALMQCPSIPSAAKVRLLEYKSRTDLALYVSRGSAPLSKSFITSFVPRNSSEGHSWPEWMHAMNNLAGDDGHAAKLLRAIGATKAISEKWKGREGFMLDGKALEMVARMVVDSVQGPGEKWIRNAGFEEAWKDVPVRGDGVGGRRGTES